MNSSLPPPKPSIGAMFPDYNRKAMVFWWTVVPLGALALAYSLGVVAMRPLGDILLTGLGMLLTGLCAKFPVRQIDEQMSFAFSDFFVFVVLVMLGPAPATVVCTFESVINVASSSRRWSSRLAGPAISAVVMFVASHLLEGAIVAFKNLGVWNLGLAVIVVVLFGAGFFLANTVMMMAIPLLKRNVRLTWSLLLGRCGAAAVVTVLSAGFAALLGYVFRDRPATVMFSAAPMLFSIIAVLHVFMRQQRAFVAAREEISEGQRREAEVTKERSLAEARLQALQAQIEPHFLYNTLANVQHMIPNQPDDAQRMLVGLIRYLRESLPRMRSPSSNVRQEFELAQAYLEIARIRFGGRLSVEVSLPRSLETMSFPPLVVQTLVENALKHGAEPKVGPVAIRIEAVDGADAVCIRVVDSGVGFGPLQGTGVGLRNTRERLTAIYGPRARLTLAPNEPSGVIAEVFVPKEPR